MRALVLLPKTRWPVYVVSWCLVVLVGGICVGDITYWTRYHAPRQPGDGSLRQAVANAEAGPDSDEKQTADALEAARRRSAAFSDDSSMPTVQYVAVGYVRNEDNTGFKGVVMAEYRDGKPYGTHVMEQGFTDVQRQDLYTRFQQNESPAPPKWLKGDAPGNTVWLETRSKPIICEVQYSSVDETSGRRINPKFKGTSD
jgi:hypothetical protein